LLAINYSFFVQLAVFLAMIFILQKFLFKPLMDLWDKRDEMIDGNRAKADELAGRVDQLIVYYEAQIWATRKLAQEDTDAAKHHGNKQLDDMLQHTRAEANEMITGLRGKIAAQYKEARGTLMTEAEKLGTEIADKILSK
jgi:F-type H+-transporting ATPase subunit b